MMKAVIYARVSTASQSEGTSLESQVEACRKYAEKEKFKVLREFREVGSGGSIYDRAQLDDLRRGVRSGLFSDIVCYAVDRLSRSISHLFILLDECDRHNVSVHFVTETLDSSPEGKLLQSVKGYVAEVEREKIRERTMRGRKQHATNGTLSYARKLFGYDVGEDGKRIINDAEADIVRSFFSEILRGQSLRSIGARLNEAGVPTPHGSKTWWGNSIHSILRNPAYCGRTYAFRYNHVTRYENGKKRVNGSIIRNEKEWVELPGVTPAIIDQATFDAVQVQLQINKKEKRRAVKHNFLLRGFIKCGTCGRYFTPHTTRHSRRYSCSSIQNPSVNCHTKSLTADKAETAVWVRVQEIISGLTIGPPPHEKTPDPLPKLDQQIAKLEREMTLIVDRSATADRRTWEMFDKQLKIKADELDRLQQHRAKVEKERRSVPKADSLKNIRARYKRKMKNLPFAEQVNVLKALGLTCTWDGIDLKVNVYAR